MEKLRAHAPYPTVFLGVSLCLLSPVGSATRRERRRMFLPFGRMVKRNAATPKTQRRFSARVRLFPGGVYSAGMTNSPGTSLPPEGTEEAGGGGLGLRGGALIGRPRCAGLTRSLPYRSAGTARHGRVTRDFLFLIYCDLPGSLLVPINLSVFFTPLFVGEFLS